jgi:hypothetical protein
MEAVALGGASPASSAATSPVIRSLGMDLAADDVGGRQAGTPEEAAANGGGPADSQLEGEPGVAPESAQLSATKKKIMSPSSPVPRLRRAAPPKEGAAVRTVNFRCGVH